MAGLAEAVHGAVGQPASMRIGVVDSTAPLAISAQGVAFNDVGLLEGYIPQTGDSVALIGQSSEAGSDPASWLALGAIQASTADLARSETDMQDALVSTTSTIYVTTGTVCSTTFVAPNSGRVFIAWRAGLLTSGGAAEAYAAPQINDSTGATLSGAADNRAISTPFASTMRFGSTTLFEFGLTPGETYTAVLMHRTTNAASAALFVSREIAVIPAP